MVNTVCNALKLGIALLSLLFSTVIFSEYAMSVEPPQPENAAGAKDIEIAGGEKGNVHFPHRKHQEGLGNCNICHSLFPKEPKAIEGMKEKGDLQKKEIMKGLCLKCHRAENQKGNESAPLTCSKCHIK